MKARWQAGCRMPAQARPATGRGTDRLRNPDTPDAPDPLNHAVFA